MINFANIKSITIPEGEVATILFLQNLVGTSIDTDGSVYNDCGYMDGYRLSSSGAVKKMDSLWHESSVTGFIPVVKSDVVYIDGCYWLNYNHALNYICGYDSNFNFIGAEYSANVNNGICYGTKFIDYVTGDKNYARAVLKNNENLAYIRVSCRAELAGQTISGSHMKVSTKSSAITAWEKYFYTNLVPLSTEADGKTIYNSGLGYKDGWRVRSGGAEATESYGVCTGYIPYQKGDKLYIYPPFFGDNTCNAVNFFDSAFNCLGQITDVGNYYGICNSSFKTNVINGVSVLDISAITVSGVEDIAYVRITHRFNELLSSGADIIITKNEEIPT